MLRETVAHRKRTVGNTIDSCFSIDYPNGGATGLSIWDADGDGIEGMIYNWRWLILNFRGITSGPGHYTALLDQAYYLEYQG